MVRLRHGRRRLVSARTLPQRGKLSEHATGRHAPVRVEDDPFGFEQRTFAPDRRRGRTPLAAEAAQAPIRRDHSLSGHARLGGAVLAHTSADGPRAAARDRSHGPISRHLTGWDSAHDGVHLGLEGCWHPLTCYASTTQCSTALPLHRHTLHSTTQTLTALRDAALPLHTQPVLGSEDALLRVAPLLGCTGLGRETLAQQAVSPLTGFAAAS